MNELVFARRITQYLEAGTDSLDKDVARKLHAAREKALARAGGAWAGLGVAGGGHLFVDLLLPARKLLSIVLLVLAVAAPPYWNSLERARQLAEVDTALLADDLPIDAYLDRGFEAWLERSSPQ